MKSKTAGVICILVLVGAWAYVHAQTAAQPLTLPNGPNGRYQVVAVEFDSSGWGGQPNEKMVIRTDTQTGQTWRLLEYADVTSDRKEGAHRLGWAKVGELP
jgi:hypothetical protein